MLLPVFLTLSLSATTGFASEVCEGAFLPSQRFLFALEPSAAPADARRLSGLLVVEESLEEAFARGRKAFVTLAPGADLDDPDFVARPLVRFERVENDDLVKLVSLSLGSGGKVTLRAEQTVSNPYGDLTPAGEVRLGQSLVKADGNYGLVRGIESTPSYDPLFKVAVARGSSSRAPLLVSQDLLVGLPGCGHQEVRNVSGESVSVTGQ